MQKKIIVNEQQLILEYQQGNNEALGGLYQGYYQLLVIIAYKYLQDTEKSRDVVGVVFEKLLALPLNKRQTIVLHPDKGLYPFLVIIVKNKCLDALKTKRLRDEIKKQIVSLVNLKVTNDVFISFEQEAIGNLLNNLPNREKEILQLHLIGYKNEEIATQLNISYNTVRNTLHIAKQRVKKLWHIFM